MDLEKTNAIISLLEGHIFVFDKILTALEYAEINVAGGFMPVNVCNYFLPSQREAVELNMVTEHDVRLELLKCAKDVADIKNVAQMFKMLVDPLKLKAMLPVWEGMMKRILKCKEGYEEFIKAEMREFTKMDIQCFYVVLGNLQRWERGLNDVYKQLGGVNVWAEDESVCSKENLPEAFKTPKATFVLSKLVEAGFLDDAYKPTERLKTIAQKTQFVDIVWEMIGLKKNEKWKHFETYWGVKHMAQQRKNTEDRVGKVKGGETMEKEIRALFG